MISVINHSQYTFKTKILTTEIKKILEAVENFYSLSHKTIEVAFVDEKHISDLCYLYFKEEKATDVLSFPDKDIKSKHISGSIAICIDVVFNYAIEDKRNLTKAFYETILHGLLHLFGLEHDYYEESLKQVYALQDEILNTLKLNEDTVNEIIEKFYSLLQD